MARRHVNDKPLKLALHNVIKRVRHDPVVLTPDEGRPHGHDEFQEIILNTSNGLILLMLFKKVEEGALLLHRQSGDQPVYVFQDLVGHGAKTPMIVPTLG